MKQSNMLTEELLLDMSELRLVNVFNSFFVKDPHIQYARNVCKNDMHTSHVFLVNIICALTDCIENWVKYPLDRVLTIRNDLLVESDINNAKFTKYFQTLHTDKSISLPYYDHYYITIEQIKFNDMYFIRISTSDCDEITYYTYTKEASHIRIVIEQLAAKM